jgi:hypothetical protein
VWLLRFYDVSVTPGSYAASMKINPVANCTLIIRSQVEYSAATQMVVLRCLLEKSATGQRRGFTDVEALLTALRAELMDLQSQILPSDQQNPINPAVIGGTRDAADPAPLPNAESPTEADAASGPNDRTN